ncbi:MAG: Leucine-tRNA ligase, partial [Candidatus Woesebacteria bacterium GW2011_GWD1_38_10]
TPHLAEEVWQKLNGQMAKLSNGYGNKQQFNNLTIKQFKSVHTQLWPSYDPKLTVEEKITIPIQINGKLRGTIEIDRDKIDDEKFVLLESKYNKVVQKWLAEGKVIKEIYVHGRLVNFVVR